MWIIVQMMFIEVIFWFIKKINVNFCYTQHTLMHVCVHTTHTHLALAVLCKSLILAQELVQTTFQQLHQCDLWECVTSDPVDLQAQVEEKRLHKPGWLEQNNKKPDCKSQFIA